MLYNSNDYLSNDARNKIRSAIKKKMSTMTNFYQQYEIDAAQLNQWLGGHCKALKLRDKFMAAICEATGKTIKEIMEG